MLTVPLPFARKVSEGNYLQKLSGEHSSKFFIAILSAKRRVREQYKENLLSESQPARLVEFRFSLSVLRSGQESFAIKNRLKKFAGVRASIPFSPHAFVS